MVWFVAVTLVAQLDAGLLGTSSVDAGVDEDTDRRRQTVVTGTRAERKLEDAVVSTEVLTRPQIEQTGARDLVQLLQQQPGVEMVNSNRSVGIRLQGLDPEYTLILIDGQRVAGRAGPAVDISRFSLRELERVEIVKGPGAALYGAEAMGGVINLITRKPKKPFEASIRGMFGTLLEGDVRGHVASKLGPLELRAGGGYRTRQPYDWDPPRLAADGKTPVGDVATSLPGQRRFDYDVEVAVAPSDKFRAWARAGYVWMDLDGIDISDSRAIFDRRQRTEQFDLWLGAQGQPWAGASLTVRGHYGMFRDQFLFDQRGARDLDDYSQSIARLYEAYAQLDQKLGAHTLTAGLEGFYELLLSNRLEIAQPTRGRFAAFVQDEWVIKPDTGFPKLTILPGIRVDADTQFGAAPSPRLALKLDPSSAVTLRTAFGLGFRPPTFTELYFRLVNAAIGYIVQGNQGLIAEKSSSVNVGVDYRPPPLDGWVFSASAWHTSLSNLINVTGSTPPNPDNPSVFTYENVSNAYTQGVELSARLRLSKGTYLDLGYMGLDARDLTRGRPLEGRSPHRANVQLSMKYRPSGLEALVRGTLHSARPFYLGTGGGAVTNVLGYGSSTTVMAPAYVDLEVQVTYTFRGWLKLFVNGYNLLNGGDAQFNPRPPRGVIGGAQLEY